MKKYGWDWTSEDAVDTYKLLLIEIGCYGGSFGDSEDLINLADEVARLEGRIPDSFEVAVDLGSIYSAAAVTNARDEKRSDEFIAKANEAWRIASSHFEKGMPDDAPLAEPGPMRTAYIGAYWQIPCEIGFARYIQTGCTDVSHLAALKKFWERAKRERPNHPALQAIGEEIDKKLPPAQEIEPMQERTPALMLGDEQSGPKPPRRSQRRQALIMGAVVAVTALSTGLAYLYRTVDGPRVSPQRGAAASGAGRTILSETMIAAPSNQRQAIAAGDPGDIAPATASSARERAEATPAPQGPAKESQQEGILLRRLQDHIRTRAKAFLALPRDIPKNTQAVYSVTVTSSGKIEELELRKSSGHAGFDQSVRAALLAAQPYSEVAKLLGNRVSRTAIVAMKAERPSQPRRETQRDDTGTASASSKQHLGNMRNGIDTSRETPSTTASQPVASSAISPPPATTPREDEECAPGFAGIICRERHRWKRCSGRWGTPGCEVYHPGETVTD